MYRTSLLVVALICAFNISANSDQSLTPDLFLAVKQAQHAVEPAGEGVYTAFNQANLQRIMFDDDSFRVTPSGGEDNWQWGLKLTGYGTPGDVGPVQAATRHASGQRIEFKRGPVTEWYENRIIGMEQGFTLAGPPASGGHQLVLELAIDGGLQPRWLEDGQAIAFHQADGSYALTYRKLVAFDADKRDLPAYLSLVDDKLQIHVDASGANWPVVIDPLVVNEQKVNAQISEGEAGDEFGYSVAVSGDTAIVGAWGEDLYDAGMLLRGNVGAAYIFVRSNDAWTLQQKLTKTVTKGADEYGRSVAIEGDTAVVGCHRCISGDYGAVYVYTRTAGVWTEQQEVRPDPAYQHHSDQFGIPVALSGETLLVGDPNDDGWVDPILYNGAGSAYVFVRSAGTWSQQAYFTVKDAGETPVAGERFGTSVALDGDTALIGNPYHTHAGPRYGGSVYVYTRSGTTWTFQTELYGSDTGFQDQFGISVALSGTSALIGDRYEDFAGSGSSAVSNAGAAYIFTGSGASWTEQAKLVSPVRAEGDTFGISTALVGDTAVVGAWNSYAWWLNYSGKVHVFERTGSTWGNPTVLYAGDDEPKNNDPGGDPEGDRFGVGVAFDGTTLAVGAPYKDDLGDQSGSAYIFELNDYSQWGQQAKLLPVVDDGAASDRFGYSVALSGDTALVSAYYDDDQGSESGSVYVLERSGSSWLMQAKLTASDGAVSDYLGYSLALHGDTALLGAPGDDTASGSVYIFVKPASGWVTTSTYDAKLTANDRAIGDYFGYSVALTEDTALIGSYYDDDKGGESGSAYVYVKPGGGWATTSSFDAKLTASDGAADDRFGVSVALSEDTALIGSYLDDDKGYNSGSAYVFNKPGGGWASTSTFDAKLTASDGEASDYFGYSVSITGDTALISALLDDDEAVNAGAAYVFIEPVTGWATTDTFDAKLTASDGRNLDLFGRSVALSGNVAAVGANEGDGNVGNSGAAYLFVRPVSGWATTNVFAHKLIASDGEWNEQYGESVALSGDTVLIGAYGDDVQGTASGSAYFYTFPCAFGHEIEVGEWSMISAPCSPASPGTVTSAFADDLTIGDYYNQWMLYERNEAADAYVAKAPSDPVDPGVGMWIKSFEAGTLDFEGTPTPVLGDPFCPSDNGCFTVDLTAPAAGGDPLFNMVGHPLPYDVNLDDLVIVIDDTTAYSLSAAESAGFVSKTVSWWNGNAYDAHDDATPGMEGRMEAFKSHWLRVLHGSDGHTVKLLIPATPSISTSQLDKELPWYAHLIDWLVPSAQAASKNDSHKTAHAAVNKGKPIKPEDPALEWYVRLIVEQPTLGLRDRNSVFGQLADSVSGFDSHDLVEQAPFGDTWLTVVFPHPEWGMEDTDFASDFHGFPARKQDGDRWVFEVRSDDPGRVLTLSWQGMEDILGRSTLIDLETGTEVSGDIGYYEFAMNGQTRRFEWLLASEAGKGKVKKK